MLDDYRMTRSITLCVGAFPFHVGLLKLSGFDGQLADTPMSGLLVE